jgi:hypothetical protein
MVSGFIFIFGPPFSALSFYGLKSSGAIWLFPAFRKTSGNSQALLLRQAISFH